MEVSEFLVVKVILHKYLRKEFSNIIEYAETINLFKIKQSMFLKL